jgi:hypothetical protein
MTRLARVGVTAVAGLALAGSSAAHARLLAFKSPTGNVTCVMSSASGSFAQCELRSTNRGYLIPRHGNVTRYDVDPFDDLAGRRFILRYGTSRRLGVFMCSSRSTGMNCRNRDTGHGFSFSRQHRRVY